MAKKILVVDDDPTVVHLIQSRMEVNGYEVISASDGEEGLKFVRDYEPNLVLLDVILPKMDGYTFVKEFKKIADLKTIPVIVMTVKSQLQDLFKQEGIEAYIIKPIKLQDLLKKVESYIGPAQGPSNPQSQQGT